MIRKLFVENLGLKLLSLALAFALWVAITGEKKDIVEIIVNSNIEFQNVPSQLEVIAFYPTQVRVRLKVQRVQLSRMDTRDVSVRVDLSGAKPGEQLVLIKRDMVMLPVNAEILSISPSYVRVKLEEIVEKAVPVKPVLVGMTPSWLDFKGYRIIPNRVKIKGTKTDVEKIRVLYTEPLDLSKLEEKTIFRLSVVPKTPLITITHPIDGIVTVEILVEEKKLRRTLILRKGSYRIEMQLEGPFRIMKELKPEDIEVTVFRRGGKLEATFNLPDGIKVITYRIRRR